MLLRDYLERENITAVAFARSAGISMQAVYRYMAGVRMPRPAVAEIIKQKTNGEVTLDDFSQSYLTQQAA